MSKIEDQDARAAIDGAIAFGRMGIKEPPAGHWLTEYWSIGRQLAELGKTSAWDNQTPVESRPAPEQSRETRDAAVQKRLDEYVRLRDGTGGCTDGGCVIKRPTGMHTNGGCKCSHDKYKAMRMMYAGQQLADALLAAMDRSALGRDAENTRSITADSAENGAPTGGRV